MPTDTVTKPEPPPAAVNADAHWAATREKLRNRQRPTSALTICDDVQVKKAYEEAKFVQRRAAAAAQDSPGDEDLKKVLAAAEKDLADAKAAFDEVAVVLEFQALRRPDFEDLKKRHPPTEEEAEDGLAVNVETLGPELIAATSLDGITIEDAAYYLTEWGEGEASALFNTAWNLQTSIRMDAGKG